MPRKTKTTDDSQNKPMLPFGDINQLMQSAQQIAQSMSADDKNKLNNMDINQMFEHVSSSLFSTMEKGGSVIDQASKDQMKVISKTMLDQVLVNVGGEENLNFKSKIDLNSDETVNNVKETTEVSVDKIPIKETEFEVLDSDEEVEELKPCMDDLKYKITVGLDEIYSGKTKKLAVNRDRIVGKSIVKEKRKLEVLILPGMKNGQEIRFNKQGNEKFGYESGDIVVTISVNNDGNYERIGNNLFCVKNISLYESYAAAKGHINVVVKHLNGNILVLKSDGHPLHSRDGARKVKNGGMPIIDKNSRKISYGDLYIRFNLILPETFEGDENLSIIERLFPILQINKDKNIFKDPSRPVPDFGDSKVNEVILEEVTPEDMEQLDFDDESSSDSDSEHDSGSE